MNTRTVVLKIYERIKESIKNDLEVLFDGTDYKLTKDDIDLVVKSQEMMVRNAMREGHHARLPKLGKFTLIAFEKNRTEYKRANQKEEKSKFFRKPTTSEERKQLRVIRFMNKTGGASSKSE